MRPWASSSLFCRKPRSSRCFSRHTDRPSKRSFIITLLWCRASGDESRTESLNKWCHYTTEQSDLWPKTAQPVQIMTWTEFFIVQCRSDNKWLSPQTRACCSDHNILVPRTHLSALGSPGWGCSSAAACPPAGPADWESERRRRLSQSLQTPWCWEK